MFAFAKANQNTNGFTSAAPAEAFSPCAFCENDMIIFMGAIVMASIIIMLRVCSLRLLVLGILLIPAIRLVYNHDTVSD